MRYLAYFQAYTNTYDRLDSLILKYEEALAYPGVEGLIVALVRTVCRKVYWIILRSFPSENSS